MGVAAAAGEDDVQGHALHAHAAGVVTEHDHRNAAAHFHAAGHRCGIDTTMVQNQLAADGMAGAPHHAVDERAAEAAADLPEGAATGPCRRTVEQGPQVGEVEAEAEVGVETGGQRQGPQAAARDQQDVKTDVDGRDQIQRTGDRSLSVKREG